MDDFQKPQNPEPVQSSPTGQNPLNQVPVQQPQTPIQSAPQMPQNPMAATPQFQQPTFQQNQPMPPASGQKDIVTKLEQITYFVYFAIAALLLFRFGLSMFGARSSIFTDFVRQISNPFMIPFTKMFGGPIGISNYRLEFEVIIAIVVYGLLFFGIARLIRIIFK